MSIADTDGHAKRTGMIAPLIVGAAGFMQSFDGSAISVALPPMAADFGVATLSLNLVITAYLIGATAFLPICGWAADRFGARRVFLCAITGFGLASLACALSTNLTVLIAARAFEGCMGALLLPVGRIIVFRAVPRDSFVRAMSVLTLPVMLGPLLGPPVGGLIVTLGSWRLMFLLNLLVAVAGFLAVRRFIDDIPAENPRPLDLKGFTLIAVALIGISYGVGMLSQSDGQALMAALFVTGGIVCALLYRHYSSRTAHPILDLGVLRLPTVSAMNIGGIFQRLIVSAVPFLLAMLFQLGFGLTPAATGGLIFTTALGSCLGRWLLTPAVQLFGFRNFLTGNSVLLAASIAVCGLFTASTPYWLIAAVLFVQGFIRSVQLLGMMSLSYAEVPERDIGHASTISSVSQQFALSLGIAVTVVALHAMLEFRGDAALSTGTIAPVFYFIALLSLLSSLWFQRLPVDAGQHLVQPRLKKAAQS